MRGLGRLYLPRYTPKKGGEKRTSSIWWWRPPRGNAVSTGCRDKRDAERWRIQRLAEMGRGSIVGIRAQATTYEDLEKLVKDRMKADGRKSLPDVECRFKHLRRSFAGRKAAGITTADITAHVAMRRDEGAAVASINVELKVLGRGFRLAVAGRRLLHEQMPEIQLLDGEHVRREFLNDGDLELIVTELPAYMRPLVRFLRLTGWRENEALALEWRRVDMERKEVVLETSKTGQPRLLSWATYPALGELVEAQKGSRGEGAKVAPWVFPGRRGPITESALQKAWRRACDRSGVRAAEGPYIHGLRRLVARELIDAGVDRRTAMSVTGHETESMFERYNIRDRSSQQAALARVAEFRSGRPAERKIVPLQKKA